MTPIPQEIANAFRKVYGELAHEKSDRLEVSYREPDPNGKTRLIVSLVTGVEETIVDGRPLDVIKGSFHRVSVWFDQSCNFEVVADRCITRLLEKRNENDPDLEEIT